MNEQQEREAFFKYLINDDQVICTPAALHHILQSNPSEWQAWQARAKFEADRAQRQAGQEPVAWMRVKPSAMPDWDEYDFSANEQEGFDVALYAAPQPAQADKDAEIAALKAEKETAYSYASGLAITLFQEHYSNDPDYASGRVVWGLCDSTTGVLTQIDNMVSGLAIAQAVQP